MIHFSPGDALRGDCHCGDTWREVSLRASIDQHLGFRRVALTVAASDTSHVEKVRFQSLAVVA
jgi:hypothetical protein